MPDLPARREESAGLALRLALPPNAHPRAHRFPLDVVFENTGESSLRLLNQFAPLPVFFGFDLRRPDGTTIPLPGAGKADFPADMLTYVVLAPGDSLTVEVDLAELFPSDLELPPGRYRVSATYHNQYGVDCYHGRAESPPIEVLVNA